MNARRLLGAAIAVTTACAVATAFVQTADPMPPPMGRGEPAQRPEHTPLPIAGEQCVQGISVRDDVAVADPAGAAAVATADDRLAALVRALDAGDDGAEQVVALRDLLREKPDLARAFASSILLPTRPARARVRLLQAMQCMGDPACQASLGAIVAADSTPASLRESALRALGGVTQPMTATLAMLWLHTHAESPTARAAVLAFARAAGALAVAQPDLHRQCCDRLRDELCRATTPDRVCVLLRSLASAHDPGVADDAMRWLSSPEATVRAAAVDVLLGVPGPRSELAVRDLLCTERDAEVRRVASRGLALRVI